MHLILGSIGNMLPQTVRNFPTTIANAYETNVAPQITPLIQAITALKARIEPILAPVARQVQEKCTIENATWLADKVAYRSVKILERTTQGARTCYTAVLANQKTVAPQVDSMEDPVVQQLSQLNDFFETNAEDIKKLLGRLANANEEISVTKEELNQLQDGTLQLFRDMQFYAQHNKIVPFADQTQAGFNNCFNLPTKYSRYVHEHDVEALMESIPSTALINHPGMKAALSDNISFSWYVKTYAKQHLEAAIADMAKLNEPVKKETPASSSSVTSGKDDTSSIEGDQPAASKKEGQ